MKNYQVKFVREYVTFVTIQANDLDEAEKKMDELISEGIIYDMELEQMNVRNEEYSIIKLK